MTSAVADVFEPLLGVPSWLVRRGTGSFITLEFGDPVVTIEEPRPWTFRPVEGESLATTRRVASVHGRWHLWIYCCEWIMEVDGTEVAWCESDDITMQRALNLLNGQALSRVEVREDAWSRFEFDLGSTLMTRPAPGGPYSDEPVDQWLLYRPDGSVVTLGGDGRWTVETAGVVEEGG